MDRTGKNGAASGPLLSDGNDYDQNKMLSHPPKALADPHILRTIGLDLTLSDLGSCRLVSHFWYTHFSPFMYWIQLEDLDAIVRRIKNSLPAPSPAKFDELYQAKLNELKHGVTIPSAAFDFHSAQRNFLSSRKTKSLRSFIYLANLVGKSIQTFAHSTVDRAKTSYDSQKFVDEVCLAVQGMTTLKSLELTAGLIDKGTFYRWSESLEAITEMDTRHSEGDQMKAWASAISSPCISMVSRRLKTPLWPELQYVELMDLQCDPLFIRTLLSHAPALCQLTIERCTILTPEQTLRPINQLKRVLKMIEAHDGIDNKADGSPLDSNTNIENSRLSYLKITKVEGALWQDVLSLARRLPKLIWFSWGGADTDFYRKLIPSPPSAGRPPSLKVLELASAPLLDIIRLVKDCKKLSILRLWTTTIDLILVRTLALRAWTLTEVTLIDCAVIGGCEALIMILSSVFTLKVFSVSGAVMECDPLWLRTPWVCKGLQELSVIPVCDRGGEFYTADMAQDAFIAQVVALPKLTTLDFMSCAGANGFHPEKSLHLLKDLKNLETLDLGTPTKENILDLTLEHAKLVVEFWPKLEKILGLRKEQLNLFKEYVREHRPEIYV